MARRRGDALERAIEDALSPGAFVGYRESWGFVEDVEAKKSNKYHGAAPGNLETVRKILLKEGGDREWNALAAEIREEHCRKSSFMPGFERLNEGRSTKEPSFRDRATSRWARGAGRRGRS